MTDEILGRSKPIEKVFESVVELPIKWLVVVAVAALAMHARATSTYIHVSRASVTLLVT